MAIRVVAQPQGVTIRVKVVPGASRDRILGELGDALKITVSKPPQGGAANEAVISLLTEALGLARGSVSIIRGHSKPRKEVFVRGVTVEQVLQLIRVLTK